MNREEQFDATVVGTEISGGSILKVPGPDGIPN